VSTRFDFGYMVWPPSAEDEMATFGLWTPVSSFTDRKIICGTCIRQIASDVELLWRENRLLMNLKRHIAIVRIIGKY
jgi:hypothetical protein